MIKSPAISSSPLEFLSQKFSILFFITLSALRLMLYYIFDRLILSMDARYVNEKTSKWIFFPIRWKLCFFWLFFTFYMIVCVLLKSLLIWEFMLHLSGKFLYVKDYFCQFYFQVNRKNWYSNNNITNEFYQFKFVEFEKLLSPIKRV